MDELFKQIRTAAEHGLYFLALAGALVIPDICGALGSPDGKTSGPVYKAWFNAHAAQRFLGKLDGDACYRFRCSLVHQGTTQHPQSPYSRILFIEPASTSSSVHLSTSSGALVIDAKSFCLDMVDAALKWEQAAVGSEPYDTNIKQFLTRYPNGLPPHIVGVPVIS